MNLKERGLTVGELIAILIFIISTVFIINKLKESKNQTYFLLAPIEVFTVKKS